MYLNKFNSNAHSLLKNLSIYCFGCAWSPIAAWAFSVAENEWGRLSSCSACPSHCGGSSVEHSLQGAAAAIAVDPELQGTGSVVVTQLLPSTWEPPGLGVEPVSPALAGEFFTTEPPDKPLAHTILNEFPSSFKSKKIWGLISY